MPFLGESDEERQKAGQPLRQGLAARAEISAARAHADFFHIRYDDAKTLHFAQDMRRGQERQRVTIIIARRYSWHFRRWRGCFITSLDHIVEMFRDRC